MMVAVLRCPRATVVVHEQVTEAEARKFCGDHGVSWFEASARTGAGVTELFAAVGASCRQCRLVLAASSHPSVTADECYSGIPGLSCKCWVTCSYAAREAPRHLQGADDSSHDNGFRVVRFERSISKSLGQDDAAASSSCCGSSRSSGDAGSGSGSGSGAASGSTK